MSKIRLAFAVSAAATCWCVCAATTSVETLELTEDTVIDVVWGDRYVIGAVTGSAAHTLKKTGAGVLQIGYCENPNAAIVVADGILEAQVPPLPAAASKAFFHVDASDASTITAVETDGTNLVSKWTDVRGAGHPYATNIGKHQPYLSANYQLGRTVMDFGSYWGGTDDNASRWGAAMEWSEGTTSFKELFTVAMDTEDLKYQGPSWSGTAGKRAGVWIGLKSHVNNAGFIYRNNRTAVAAGADPSGAQNAPILNSGCSWASSALVKLDGETSGGGTAYSCGTRYPDGMHVLTLVNTSDKEARANTFASERGNAYGGIRMGETLVFTESLTADERTAIETYLLKKWKTGQFGLARLQVGEGCALRLPQGGTVTVGEYANDGAFEGPGTVVAGSTTSSDLVLTADAEITVAAGETRVIRNLSGGAYTLTKKGEGKLVIEYCASDAIGVTAEAGTLEIRRNNAPALLASAAFHVDASLTNTCTLVEETGAKYVATWADVRGAGYATATALDNRPFLKPAFANGRTVVDFGTLYNGTLTAGWGASLDYSTSFKPLEVFMVAGDNELAKDCVDGTGGASHRNNTLFGHKSTTTPIYRGNGKTGGTSEIINSSSAFYQSSVLCSLDGVAVKPAKTPLPDGLHVIGYSFTDATYLANPTVEVDSFARERDQEKGGLRIAEYIIFTNSLTAVERTFVVDYLRDRWTKPFRMGRLEIAAGATLSLPDADRVLTAESVLSGAVTGSGFVSSASRQLGTITLKADEWIDVPLGEVAVIDKVTGAYGYAIVKTGLGTLVIGESDNEKARLIVKEGPVVIGEAGENASATFGEINVASGTSVTITDGTTCTADLLTDAGGTVIGTLDAGAVADGSSIALTRGTVVMDPLANATAFFHVDAAKTNLISFSSTGPTNVFCWSDVRGRKARNGGDRPSDAGNFAWMGTGGTGGIHFPNWGGNGFTQNGLPVMDFGEVFIVGDTAGKPMKWLQWDQGCWDVREFILVVGDNEKVKDREATNTGGNAVRNQAFLGHLASPGGNVGPNTVMARGNRTQGSASPYILGASTLGNNISFACDGAAVEWPTVDKFPDGMHVVAASISEERVVSSNVFFNTFARERNSVYGGQRLGEALIFKHRLHENERNEYLRLLQTKWFGSNAVVRTQADVSVPAGTSLSLPYQSLTVTNDFTLGGTLAAVEVTAPATITISGTAGAEVTGALRLPASGTFVMDDSWKTARGGKHRLIGATELTFAGGGSIDNWSVTMPAGSRCADVVLSREADGIYLTLSRGIVLIFR